MHKCNLLLGVSMCYLFVYIQIYMCAWECCCDDDDRKLNRSQGMSIVSNYRRKTKSRRNFMFEIPNQRQNK